MDSFQSNRRQATSFIENQFLDDDDPYQIKESVVHSPRVTNMRPKLDFCKSPYQNSDSECEIECSTERVNLTYETTHRPPTHYHSPRVVAQKSDFDETKTMNKLTRFKTMTHQFKSPLKDEVQKLKTKEGILLKKKDPKQTFKKEYKAMLKDGVFQLFETKEPFKMKLTLVFNQVPVNVDRYRDFLKVEASSCQIYLKAKEQNEIKEWMIAMLFQIKLFRAFSSPIPQQPKFYKFHFLSTNEFQIEAQNLDIILFKSRNMGATMQRFVTNSDYDHVGMILRTCEDEIYLFEANSDDGVGLWSWKNFLTHDWKKAFEKVVFRKLNCQRPPQRIEKLQAFVRQALGKKYQLTLAKLFKKKSVSTNEQALENRTYFCSELIAATLKKVGLLLNPDISSTQFWPKDFSEDRTIPLKEGASYGHEMVLY